MESPRANEEALKVILTKLYRLETAFNETNNRLSTIEHSVVSDAGGSSVARAFGSLSLASCSCASCVVPQPVHQNVHRETCRRHPEAAAYKASVGKLREQFDLDVDTELASANHEEDPVYAHDDEDQSKIANNLLPKSRLYDMKTLLHVQDR
ncbi:uncharacterized protein ColSpa_10281 [Colletotrichum spaethianum]|uniref:Uncharacterized protein n=1 Tax=Colletotrichum spaethianum TaxID=700344 RepID=A0AA37UP70_9PEZI|nr:uncharacterized protein ColSpa_10281 [Colletotrichum spaethianum]GKT50100.1 hypothetical protein ColSpa_10281 [Colletotrichum spaethianum]